MESVAKTNEPKPTGSRTTALSARERQIRLKQHRYNDLVEVLGGYCGSCGTDYPLKIYGTGRRVYLSDAWHQVVKNGDPAGFRLLCPNCEWIIKHPELAR